MGPIIASKSNMEKPAPHLWYCQTPAKELIFFYGWVRLGWGVQEFKRVEERRRGGVVKGSKELGGRGFGLG